MSKDKPQSHPASSHPAAKSAAAVPATPKEVVKPHEAVDTGAEVESAKPKAGGTSPAESARKESAADTYEGPGTGGSVSQAEKDEAQRAADAKVKADEAKEEWHAERRTEPVAKVEKKFGLRHGELRSYADSEGAINNSPEPEGFTEQHAKELRAIEDFNRGDDGPMKALGFIEIMQVVKWLTTEVGEDLPALIAEYSDFKNAGSLSERWAALKQIGDILVEDLEEFPFDLSSFDKSRTIFQASAETYNDREMNELEGFAAKRGVDFATLVNFVREVLPLVLELISFLKTR